MSIGDVYRLKDFQTFLGVQVLNVYYYEMTAGTGGAEDLFTAFTLDMLPELVQLQTADITHTLIEVVNMGSLTDWYESGFTSGNVGLATTDSSSPFHAYGFRLVRSSRATRHGYKRIAGVSGNDVTDGVIDDATTLSRISNLATVMGSNVADTLGQEFKPIIARISNVGTVTATNDVQQAVYYGLTTQNTRKFGRGA